jgi:hypothetical protein
MEMPEACHAVVKVRSAPKALPETAICKFLLCPQAPDNAKLARSKGPRIEGNSMNTNSSTNPETAAKSPAAEVWPALPLDAWKDTYATLHMWTQIVGKLRLALTPRVNHWWNVPFHLTARGLTTTPMKHERGVLEVEFDFVDHELRLRADDGREKALPLIPRTVADFYKEFMATLASMGVNAPVWPMPVEIPEPVRFDQDTVHASYDAKYVEAFWRILLGLGPIFEEFRSRFIGKCSPVHFFWGSFDFCVTRFSGRRAPERPGADSITREAYSHEVISAGWWPGGGKINEPAFYAYAVPEPPGFAEAKILPAAARYSRDLGEFIFPYDDMRAASSPRLALLDFLQSTYEAGANLADWDRQALEKLPAKSTTHAA